ncbi:MAG: helix-turn-helix domain-containing protein [Chloroflexota bacterium]|nr:helix-turn-helix domain-containing protein [Chloroflexota bacterium]MDP9469545.1 helix-turn-helix domain-containing protein [Chloroflexota bacterium]
MAGPSPPDELPIGRRLKMRRDALGKSAQEVAGLAGISVSQLSRIERGHHEPRWRTVERLFLVLGITLREEVNGGDRAA